MRHLFWICALVLMGCAKSEHAGTTAGSSGNLQSASGAGFEAFKTFYNFANNQGCVKCHGAVVTPKFAAPDLAFAYSQAKGLQNGSTLPLIDFNDPDSSIIAVYAGNGHCGDTPCSSPANTPTVKAMLEAWAIGELASQGGGTQTGGGTGSAVTPTYLTANLVLPATIATYDAAATASTPLRFELKSLVPSSNLAKFDNAILEVEVRYTGPSQTHYRFNNMKIYGNSAAGAIAGLHLFIRGATQMGLGIEDPQQSPLWNALGKPTAVPIPVAARPANLPATRVNVTPFATTSLIVPRTGAGDVITLGIEVLQ